MIISAGNDIVDLGTIDIARTKDVKFYTKFITGPEIALYNQPQLATLPFEYFVWMLWSVKESVYKFIQRHNSDLVFSPSKIVTKRINAPLAAGITAITDKPIECLGFNNTSYYSNTVTYGTDIFYSRSVINDAYILTLVNNSDNFDDIYWGVKPIGNDSPEYQSTAVRQFILQKITLVFNSNHHQIIKNPFGCPILYNGFNQTQIPVSLAHHGRFIAYAFLLAR